MNEFKTTIHEAGHAIRGWYSGARISKIWISGEDGETVMNHPIMRTLHKISWPHPLLKDFVDCMLAGISACLYEDCNIASGKKPDNSDTDDIEVAMHTLKNSGWESDICTEDGFYAAMSMSSKIFVISHAREIRLLASELMKKKEMSGFECVRYIESIWKGPLPEKALRYWEHKGGN